MKFSETKYEVSEEKKPTLKQYVKANKGKKIPKLFTVILIWVPNKFPAFNLDCDKFRVSISESSPLGKDLRNCIDVIVEDTTTTKVSIEFGDNDREYLVFSDGKDKGYWEQIGSEKVMGYRFVFD